MPPFASVTVSFRCMFASLNMNSPIDINGANLVPDTIADANLEVQCEWALTRLKCGISGDFHFTL